MQGVHSLTARLRGDRGVQQALWRSFGTPRRTRTFSSPSFSQRITSSSPKSRGFFFSLHGVTPHPPVGGHCEWDGTSAMTADEPSRRWARAARARGSYKTLYQLRFAAGLKAFSVPPDQNQVHAKLHLQASGCFQHWA